MENGVKNLKGSEAIPQNLLQSRILKCLCTIILFETSSFLVYVYYSLMKSSGKKIVNHPKGGGQ